MRKALAALAAALIISAPLAARAQIVDQQPYSDQGPSYAEPADNGEAQIHGRILTFDGGYNLQVKDEKGYVDAIQLHQGTIINPTGLTLAPGMVVSIMGYNAGSFFAANQIDTPYTFYGGSPYYGGHPWSYYGPSVSLGFFFGNTGWWHGSYFGSPVRWSGGVRYYNNVRVNDTYYRGGTFSGRNYVAPRNFGGYYPPNERRYPANGGGYNRGNGGGYERRDNGGERHESGGERRDGGSDRRGGGGGGDHEGRHR